MQSRSYELTHDELAEVGRSTAREMHLWGGRELSVVVDADNQIVAMGTTDAVTGKQSGRFRPEFRRQGGLEAMYVQPFVEEGRPLTSENPLEKALNRFRRTQKEAGVDRHYMMLQALALPAGTGVEFHTQGLDLDPGTNLDPNVGHIQIVSDENTSNFPLHSLTVLPEDINLFSRLRLTVTDPEVVVGGEYVDRLDDTTYMIRLGSNIKRPTQVRLGSRTITLDMRYRNGRALIRVKDSNTHPERPLSQETLSVEVPTTLPLVQQQFLVTESPLQPAASYRAHTELPSSLEKREIQEQMVAMFLAQPPSMTLEIWNSLDSKMRQFVLETFKWYDQTHMQPGPVFDAVYQTIQQQMTQQKEA